MTYQRVVEQRWYIGLVFEIKARIIYLRTHRIIFIDRGGHGWLERATEVWRTIQEYIIEVIVYFDLLPKIFF